jgi:hypothetical protein
MQRINHLISLVSALSGLVSGRQRLLSLSFESFKDLAIQIGVAEPSPGCIPPSLMARSSSSA